jgi:hypothetical protein
MQRLTSYSAGNTLRPQNRDQLCYSKAVTGNNYENHTKHKHTPWTECRVLVCFSSCCIWYPLDFKELIIKTEFCHISYHSSFQPSIFNNS